MPNYSQRFLQKILEISLEKHQVDLALREWRFSGSFRDYGAPTAACDLCGSTGLRYHFRIANQFTGETCWVGSQCILNFDLAENPVGPKVHTTRSKKQQLRDQIREAHITRLLAPIQQLYEQVGKSDQRRVHWAVGRFQRRGAFSPKDLAWLFQAMQFIEIPYSPQDFPLTLRTRQDRLEYARLTVTGRSLIDAALDPEQRNNLTR